MPGTSNLWLNTSVDGTAPRKQVRLACRIVHLQRRSAYLLEAHIILSRLRRPKMPPDNLLAVFIFGLKDPFSLGVHCSHRGAPCPAPWSPAHLPVTANFISLFAPPIMRLAPTQGSPPTCPQALGGSTHMSLLSPAGAITAPIRPRRAPTIACAAAGLPRPAQHMSQDSPCWCGAAAWARWARSLRSD